MPDNKSAPLALELITKCMNESAREFDSIIDIDDPRRSAILEELVQLTQLRRAMIFANQPFAEQSMNALAREMTTLKPGDSRRKEIVEEIMRLRDLVK